MPAPRSHTWISKPSLPPARSTRCRGGAPWARAFSSRLVTARLIAIGRTRRCIGSSAIVSGTAPTTAAASATSCSRGTSSGDSCSAPANNRNWRVMRSSALRSASAPAQSWRRRSLVSGARRSWAMPASIVLRSMLARSNRASMALKCCVNCRTAAAPQAGKAAGLTSRPTAPRACSSWRRGRCTSTAKNSRPVVSPATPRARESRRGSGGQPRSEGNGANNQTVSSGDPSSTHTPRGPLSLGQTAGQRGRWRQSAARSWRAWSRNW